MRNYRWFYDALETFRYLIDIFVGKFQSIAPENLERRALIKANKYLNP